MSKTKRLRAECKRRGIKYDVGLYDGVDGPKYNVDKVTTLWDGTDAGKSLTFEEDESGALWCADELTVAEAIGAYLAGLESDDG